MNLINTGYDFSYFTIALAPVNVACSNKNTNAVMNQYPYNRSDIMVHRFADISIPWNSVTILSLYSPMYVQVTIDGDVGLNITGTNVVISNMTVAKSRILFAYSSGSYFKLINVTATHLLEVDVIESTAITLQNVSGGVFVSNVASPLSDVNILIINGSLPAVVVWCMLSVPGQRCSTNDISLSPFGVNTFTREFGRLRPPCPVISAHKSTTGVYVGIGVLVAILVSLILIFIIHHFTVHSKVMLD
jgi:hypothetical protein